MEGIDGLVITVLFGFGHLSAPDLHLLVALHTIRTHSPSPPSSK